MLDTAESGDPTRPVLVLLHAGGMTRKEWDPFLSGWEADFRLVTMTAPGHGASPIATKITIDDLVASTMETLDRLGLSRVHLLGSSMGGATALHLAFHHPDRVDRLVLYRSGFRTTPGAREALSRLATPETWQRWGLAHWMEREHEPQGGPSAWMEVIRRVPAIFDRTEAALGTADLLRVESPVLIIGGDRDDLVPLEDLLTMYRSFREASLWIVPGAGHLLGMESWRRPAFLEEVHRFLLRPHGGPSAPRSG